MPEHHQHQETPCHALSDRGRELLDRPPFPEYLREHFERSAGAVAGAQPDGYIPLCIAENKLVWDLLQPKMAACRDVSHGALCYDTMIGSYLFRQQLAAFLSRSFLGRQVSAEQLAVLTGAGSVLELFFYAVGDPGDGVLVPTPSYAGFWMDLQTRNRLVIVPVHCASEDNFRLTPERLEQALQSAGRPVRALLLTTPNNPLGTVFRPQELEEILAWAEGHRLHMLLDEIYALSVFGERPFVSGASLRLSLGQRLHIVWAFSKDFGASGLRCGVLVSENEGLLRAVEALSYWACCSGDTQHLLGRMISDQEWVDHYLQQMQARLRSAHAEVTGALAGAGIPHVAAEAGFFLLCDLRPFLPEVTWQEEDRLWRRLLHEANVNLTPGSACHNGEPGFMRLCYASVPPAVTVQAIERISRVLSYRNA